MNARINVLDSELRANSMVQKTRAFIILYHIKNVKMMAIHTDERVTQPFDKAYPIYFVRYTSGSRR